MIMLEYSIKFKYLNKDNNFSNNLELNRGLKKAEAPTLSLTFAPLSLWV